MYFLYEMSVINADSVDPDQTPRFAASDLGLHCLPTSHFWDARHKWVKFNIFFRGEIRNFVVVLIEKACNLLILLCVYSSHRCANVKLYTTSSALTIMMDINVPSSIIIYQQNNNRKYQNGHNSSFYSFSLLAIVNSLLAIEVHRSW